MNYISLVFCQVTTFLLLTKLALVSVITMGSPSMGLLQDTQNRGLLMCRECWERFPNHRRQRKPIVSDPGINHGTCVTHVPWCMLGSLNRGGMENVPGIPGACATRNITYLVRGPYNNHFISLLVIWLQSCKTTHRYGSCIHRNIDIVIVLLIPEG